MPQLRKDPVLGRWVIISTERAKRPSDFSAPERGQRSEPDRCPFCPGNEKMTPPEVTRRPLDGDWRVRVVPNKFPALTVEGGTERAGAGIYDRMNGVGAHEVIIETPEHDRMLSDLAPPAIAEVLEVFRARALDLARDERIRYVLVFKNHGLSAGASLSHSHSQLIATPVVPVRVKAELEGAAKYFDFRGRCIFCDMVKQETEERVRLVYENERFVCFEPFAPRFPFETWLLPRAHFSGYDGLSDGHLADLAEALHECLVRMNRALSCPDYNFLVHVAPLVGDGNEHYHFHIELMPKLTRIAGFEVGSGFYINPVPPEEAARFLREA